MWWVAGLPAERESPPCAFCSELPLTEPSVLAPRQWPSKCRLSYGAGSPCRLEDREAGSRMLVVGASEWELPWQELTQKAIRWAARVGWSKGLS